MEENKNNTPFFAFGAEEFTAPVFSEDTGKQDWVTFGSDNLFDRHLLGLYNKSLKHSSIINKKVSLTASGGWVNNSPTVDTFIKNENNSEDLNNIVWKNVFNLMIYGSFALIITWSKDRKSIARIKFVDTSKTRIAKTVIDEKDDAERFKRQEDGVEFYYISGDWSNTRKHMYRPKLIQGFSEEYNKDEDETTQLFYVKAYNPNSEYYGLPDWLSDSGQSWINLDFEVANFHNQSAMRGYSPSMVIKMRQGVPNPEEMRIQKRKMEELYAGTQNAGKTIMTFSGAEDDPIFEPFQTNDSDNKYINLETLIGNNIINMHSIPGILATRETAGKLGGNAEILEASILFQTNTIAAYQKLVDRAFTKLLNVSSPNEVMELNEVKILPEDIEVTEEAGIPSEGVVPEAADENALAQANLRGSVGGVNGILQIQQSFNDEITSKGSALAILMEIYGFSEEVSLSLLGVLNDNKEILND